MSRAKTIPLEDFPWERRAENPAADPAADPQEKQRGCEHADCQAVGDHRAPRSRNEINSYYWFCLDHVQEYNKQWNYFSGMSENEVEAHNRADTIGWRPSWPLGPRGEPVNRLHFEKTRINDPYGFSFFREKKKKAREKADNRKSGAKDHNPVSRALALFGLTAPTTLEEMKARYKTLVKRHHPDANGGDKKAEERLKGINEAYGILKSFFQTN